MGGVGGGDALALCVTAAALLAACDNEREART